MEIPIFIDSFMALGYTLIPRYAAHLLCMDRMKCGTHMCEIIDPVRVVVATLAGWGLRWGELGVCMFGTKGGIHPVPPTLSAGIFIVCMCVCVCVCVRERKRERERRGRERESKRCKVILSFDVYVTIISLQAYM